MSFNTTDTHRQTEKLNVIAIVHKSIGGNSSKIFTRPRISSVSRNQSNPKFSLSRSSLNLTEISLSESLNCRRKQKLKNFLCNNLHSILLKFPWRRKYFFLTWMLIFRQHKSSQNIITLMNPFTTRSHTLSLRWEKHLT